jgi:hypothetical protein
MLFPKFDHVLKQSASILELAPLGPLAQTRRMQLEHPQISVYRKNRDVRWREGRSSPCCRVEIRGVSYY